MQRVFIMEEMIQGDVIHITGDVIHHLQHVMRSQIGDRLVCCDGLGTDFLVQISHMQKDHIRCEILERAESLGEPQRKVTVAQSLPKGDKFEWVIQKGTEIGANQFIPFTSTRTIVKLSPEKEVKKRKRWQKIASEAAEQSGRGQIPLIEPVHTWSELITLFSTFDQVWIAYEGGGEPLSERLPTPVSDRLLVLIGPEGGFSEPEVLEAQAHGAMPVTLGPRILRTETAPLFILASIFATGGD